MVSNTLGINLLKTVEHRMLKVVNLKHQYIKRKQEQRREKRERENLTQTQWSLFVWRTDPSLVSHNETTTQNPTVMESDIRSSNDVQLQFIDSFTSCSRYGPSAQFSSLSHKMHRLRMFHSIWTSSLIFFISILHTSIFTKYIYSTLIYSILLEAPYIYNYLL